MIKNNKLWLLAILTITLFSIVPNQAFAQQGVRSDPGFVDLDGVGGLNEFFNRDPKIDVSVEGALMKLVAEASRLEDPELANLLLKLKGVYVRGYETSRSESERARGHANKIGQDLVDAGWSSVIRVRNEQEHFQMCARYRGETIIGMVVLSIDVGAHETTFLNIVGNIDPGQIGRIGQKFNIGRVPNLD